MARRAVLPIIRLAKSGDAENQYRLGALYLEGGHGLGASEATAYLWLSRAAAQGWAAAWLLIGERVSPAAAAGDPGLVRWYEQAVQAGSTAARVKLARLLVQGDHAGVGPGGERAAALLRAAAAQGSGEACYELGVMLLRHPRDDADRAEGCRLLEQADARGQAGAARLLADYHWETRNLQQCHFWYGRCADLSDPELCYRVGMVHTLLGLPGAQWLERAAKEGHSSACEELGIRHAAGCAGTTRRSLKKAARWLERAASCGSSSACHLLSVLYHHPGTGLHDLQRSHAWLFEAACRGHPQAQLRAALTILRDLDAGRKPDAAEVGAADADVLAARYFAAAARRGAEEAETGLARLAARPKVPAGPPEAQWDAFVAALQHKDPPMAARVRLGRTFGLTTRELLLLDPAACDRGDWLAVDLAVPGAPRRRRLLPIGTDSQRRIIDEAKEAVGREGVLPAAWGREYIARQRRLRRLTLSAGIPGIEAALFPRVDRQRPRPTADGAQVAQGAGGGQPTAGACGS